MGIIANAAAVSRAEPRDMDSDVAKQRTIVQMKSRGQNGDVDSVDSEPSTEDDESEGDDLPIGSVNWLACQ